MSLEDFNAGFDKASAYWRDRVRGLLIRGIIQGQRLRVDQDGRLYLEKAESVATRVLEDFEKDPPAEGRTP